MSGKQRDIPTTHPTVLALVLDWYGAELQKEPGSWLPKMSHSGWHQRRESGMTPGEWHECEQCTDGMTKRGPCRNCDGVGRWSFDRYDSEERRVGSDATTVERCMTPAEYDHALQLGLEPLTLDQELARLLSPLAAPTLRKTEDTLIRMRGDYPHFRGALVCAHLLRIPYPAEHYQGGIAVMAAFLGPHFRVPGWLMDASELRVKADAARRKARKLAA